MGLRHWQRSTAIDLAKVEPRISQRCPDTRNLEIHLFCRKITGETLIYSHVYAAPVRPIAVGSSHSPVAMETKQSHFDIHVGKKRSKVETSIDFPRMRGALIHLFKQTREFRQRVFQD